MTEFQRKYFKISSKWKKEFRKTSKTVERLCFLISITGPSRMMMNGDGV
jgi:hypothetical protein